MPDAPERIASLWTLTLPTGDSQRKLRYGLAKEGAIGVRSPLVTESIHFGALQLYGRLGDTLAAKTPGMIVPCKRAPGLEARTLVDGAMLGVYSLVLAAAGFRSL